RARPRRIEVDPVLHHLIPFDVQDVHTLVGYRAARALPLGLETKGDFVSLLDNVGGLGVEVGKHVAIAFYGFLVVLLARGGSVDIGFMANELRREHLVDRLEFSRVPALNQLFYKTSVVHNVSLLTELDARRRPRCLLASLPSQVRWSWQHVDWLQLGMALRISGALAASCRKSPER